MVASSANSDTSDVRRKPALGHDAKVAVGKFEIDTSRPLTAFDHQYAEGFECISFETGLNDHVALVIKGRYPARRDIIEASINSEANGMLTMRTAQVILWPIDNTQRYVLIYRRPVGNALFQKHTQQREPLSEETLRFAIIKPLFIALRSLADRRLFHGNIRPDNIFLTNPENPEAILGDCASSAPGMIQPALYETIERAMADPMGKGIGHSQDDIYAMGVTVAVLMHGKSPLDGKTPEAIIDEKINRGSYAALTDGLRLSPAYAEFFRATLHDDPRYRWNIDQLASWVDGTRTTPKQMAMPSKAQRAIDFNGRKYIRAKSLAKDLPNNIEEAVALIESGNLGKWLERALNEPQLLASLNAAINRAAGSGRSSGYEERLICLVSMALDPNAPIRFRDLAVFPSGIGYMLAFAMIEGKNVQNIAELMRDRFAWMWLHQRDHSDGIQQALIQAMDQASKMISRRGLNQGLERCLYEICEDAPCLSDLFTDHYVINSALLLNALDDVAAKNKDKRPMDRHIASFIMARDPHDHAGLVLLLEGADLMRRSLAMLTIYQQMQKRNDIDKLENLAEWLLKDAEQVVTRFKSIKLKAEILKQLPKEARSGNLTSLLLLVDSVNNVRKDEKDFATALNYYHSYGQEQEHIRRNLENNPYFGFDVGRQIAFFAAVIISGIMIICTFLMNFMDAGQ